jgi:GTPase SAR1 family protein
MLGNEVVLCIVGNKIDLEKDRHVSIKTAEDYAKSVNAKLYHTSAKLNKGVEELFSDLAQRKLIDRKKIIKICYFVLGMLEKVPQTPNTPTTDTSGRQSTFQVGAQNQNNEKKSGGCC